MGEGVSLQVYGRGQPCEGCPKRRPNTSAVWGVRAPGCCAKQQGKPHVPDTYPNHHGLIAFKFGDEFVPSENLRFVEGPEPAHHFDAAFSWIRHLGRQQGGGAGMGGGPGLSRTREEATNRTAYSEAASCSLQRSFSAGHRELGGLGSSGRSQTGFYPPPAPPAADLTSLALPWPGAALQAHLPATTRPAD